jgi:Predicted ATPase (AAA+ superfamily)
MNRIERDKYLNQLISKKDNGMVKVITGIRRCGKSYLLFNIYHQYLNSLGIQDDCIIEINLEIVSSARLRNPFELDTHIRTLISDSSKPYYVFIDEIQKVSEVENPYVKGEKLGFVDVLLGLMRIENADIYVTGSNSCMLSSDILSSFRGRGDEIRINPLSYREFLSAFDGNEDSAWHEYYTYGGMPYTLSLRTHEEKSKYLKDLYEKTYLSDILDRRQIHNDRKVIDDLISTVSSSIGSLTNPTRLANTLKSVAGQAISSDTVNTYLEYFVDAFLIEKALRYDVKGRKYINSLAKYYFSDVGIRNARLNFRQQEENHIMENIIYNELRTRGFDVDIGIVEFNFKDAEKKNRKTFLEIDFVANRADSRYYIQSAFSIPDEEKRNQETKSIRRIPDSFRKIVVVRDRIIPWHDEWGILYLGIERFLLDEESIDL